MSEQELDRLVRVVSAWRGFLHPVIWQRTPEMHQVRRRLMQDIDQALGAGEEGTG